MPSATIQYEVTEEASVTFKRPSSYKGSPFFSIGKAGTTKHNKEGFPMANIMKNLSTSATWLYWSLVEKRNSISNEVYFPTKTLTKAEKNRVSRGYKELNNQNMVKRIKREYYLLNPATVIPHPKDNYEDVEQHWNSIP